MTSEAVTTAIAIRDETSAVMLTNAQLKMIANTSFVPAAFRGKVPEVLACVATGRALGLPDMTSLRGIHVIEGKATLSAELMVAIVRGHGHSITGTVGEKEAIVRGRRADNGDEMEAAFTTAMAEKAGLTGKQNWKRHPDDMMWARAVSRLCRRLFADCFAGASYVPEEVEATADETLDEPPDPPSAEEQERLADEWELSGLAEPESHGGQGEPVTSSVTEHEIASGSASSWQDLVQTTKTLGLSKETLVEALREYFPGHRWNQLTPAQCEVLRAALKHKAAAHA